MITKKGSHVGIVLSFVIFVTFVMFFYLMIQPALATESKQAVLNTLEGSIIEMASAELTAASVFVEIPPQDCARLDDFFGDTEMGGKIIVLDENGNTVTAKKNSQDLYVEREEHTFLKIYESEEFSAIDEGQISPCIPMDYEFGLVKNTTEIFETKILYIIERHGDDYQTLKQDLNVPAGSEFGFNFTYADGKSVSTVDSAAKTSIFAEEFPVKYITDDAEIKAGILRIKVW
jgi:hypothetical protein